MSKYFDAVSNKLVNGFLEDEFTTFKTLYRDPNASLDEQDQRSLAMLWVCRFLKPLVNEEFGKSIHDFVEKVMNEEDYSQHGWQRISSLQAISYLLTKNKDHLIDLVSHISSSNSTVRPVILYSCSVIIDHIPEPCTHLKKSAEVNVAHSQMFFKESVLLYLCSKENSKVKKKWHLTMKKQYREHHKEFFESLKETDFYKNEFYLDAFSEAKSYFIFKMIAESAEGISISEQSNSNLDSKELFKSLQTNEKNHPLSGQYIDLSFLKDEKIGLFKQD